MSDVENLSTAALMQVFDGAIKSRIPASQAKPDIAYIDPRLKSIFTTAVARAYDVVDLSPQEICEAFLHLSAAGLDDPIVTRPPHIRINERRAEPLLPENPYNRTVPIVRPVSDDDGVPLGVRS